MTGNELQPAADMANTYGTGTWDVFWAWVFTPTGAVIFLLMLGVVIATVVMKPSSSCSSCGSSAASSRRGVCP